MPTTRTRFIGANFREGKNGTGLKGSPVSLKTRHLELHFSTSNCSPTSFTFRSLTFAVTLSLFCFAIITTRLFPQMRSFLGRQPTTSKRHCSRISHDEALIRLLPAAKHVRRQSESSEVSVISDASSPSCLCPNMKTPQQKDLAALFGGLFRLSASAPK